MLEDTIDAKFAEDREDICEGLKYAESVSGIWHPKVRFPVLLNLPGNNERRGKVI